MLLWVLVWSFLAPHIHSDSAPCSNYQVPFNNSCYELVRLERTFHSAQSWCERGGGHLVFIDHQETQDFLETYLPEDQDWWIGLIYNSQSGSITWLDTSNVTFTYWGSGDHPQVQGNCGYMKKGSRYRWSTDSCSQELFFICQFEFGHTIACDNQNATVQCGSGEVIQITDSFYGRKSPYFCNQENLSQSTSDCSWSNVKDLVAAQCHGLQACQITTDSALFGSPCPKSGSYLSIDYSCREGLQIELPDMCLVDENITLTLNWLLSPFTGNLSCIISVGDGYSIDPYQPLNTSSSITHSFTIPGEFTVFVECSTSEWHVTAQKAIIVEERSALLNITGCSSKYGSNHEVCSTDYGETMWIQVEINTGGEVNYSLLFNNITLRQFRVTSEGAPHNLTLDNAAQQLLGPGVHILQIMAYSNRTTSIRTSNVTVHLVEPISGLWADLSTSILEVGTKLQINVSISYGAPVNFKFELIGFNETFTHLKENSLGLPTTYTIPVELEGTYLVKVVAYNSFSNMSLIIGNVIVKRIQALRIEPARYLNPFNNVTLRWSDSIYTNISWTCGFCWPRWFECLEQNLIDTSSDKIMIPAGCLPPPNTAFTVLATVSPSKEEVLQDEQCLYVTARSHLPVKISCKGNCKNTNMEEDMEFQSTCDSCDKIKYNWYLDDHFPIKSTSLPDACLMHDFKQSSLLLLQSDASTLVLNSTFLKSQTKWAFKIKVIAMNIHEYGEDSLVVSTLPPPERPNCTVFPEEGSVLNSFQISCLPPCSGMDSCIKDKKVPLTYCIYPKPNSQLYCGPDLQLSPIFLPVGEKESDFILNITVTVSNNFGDSVNTTVKVK
ncbi:hypothetical protein GDO86_017156, partial [Hymenochirus boettgeri]